MALLYKIALAIPAVTFHLRLPTCNDHLAKGTNIQRVQLHTDLAGRELDNVEDIEKLLEELRERLMGQLKADVRIRLV